MADEQGYPEGTRVVNVPGDPTPHVFAPTDGKPATDAQISAALKAIPAANAPQAPRARTWSFSRLPDPEGAFALSEQAEESPKSAVAGAVAGLALPAVPAALGLATRAAAGVADIVNPDLVGIVSPRVAHALRIAQKVVEASKAAVPAAAATADKMHINATDVIRIKSLMEQGIAQSEAVKTIMNLRTMGKLP